MVRLPELHDWYHEDPDGRPWMIVSHDFVVDRSIRATLRVDYDGRIYAVAGVPPVSIGTTAYVRLMLRSTRTHLTASAGMAWHRTSRRLSPVNGSPSTLPAERVAEGGLGSDYGW